MKKKVSALTKARSALKKAEKVTSLRGIKAKLKKKEK
jgi:hypothetical protein